MTRIELVIDDSPTIRKMVECHLSQAGYRVALAPDAERGLAMAATIRPDLILLDHQLPGTTGDQVCRRHSGAVLPVGNGPCLATIVEGPGIS